MFDLVALGDITTDDFIKLKEAEVTAGDNPKICLPFGEKIPYDFHQTVPAVGNAGNAAVCAARLGLSSALVSNLGDDRIGEASLEHLKGDNVDTRFVALHKNMPSNFHYVLWYSAERTILTHHEAYPYVLPDIAEPKWVYLTSFGESALPFQDVIAEYLVAHPNIKMAFQPDHFQIGWGAMRLKAIYARAEIVFCNKEESQAILGTSESDPKKLLGAMRALGPKITIITDGPKGAYAADAAEAWFMPPYPDPKPPYERTGAGDAFSSTTVVALSLGKNLGEALAWGAANAMAVVQEIGAQKGLLNRTKLEALLAAAPADFKATPI